MPVTLDGTTGIALTGNAGLTQNGNGTISFTSSLAVTGGGTGLTNVGATGNVLTSNGSYWVSQSLPPVSNTIASPNFTGNIYLDGSVRSNIANVTALNIDCSLGNYFIKTIAANSTFTVSNVPSSRAYSFVLELTHTSGTVTWFSGVEWPGGTAPSLTTGKTHLFVFLTDDSGSRWRGSALTNYTN